MSKFDGDDVARFQAAFAKGDSAALEKLVHPEFEVIQSRALPYGGSYRGVEGFTRFVALFMGTWNIEVFDTVARFDKASTVPGEQEVVILFHLVGSAAATGERIDTTLLEHWIFRDGKLAYAKPHWFEPPLNG